MRPWFDDDSLWGDDARTTYRPCAHKGCRMQGVHRAPKSAENLNDYLWFCKPHARAWNESWDFAKNLSPEQMDRLQREDVTWGRQTWPLGTAQLKDKLYRKAASFRNGDSSASADDAEAAARSAAAPRRISPEMDKALQCLDLTLPLSMIELRERYKLLVKRHHPDANGGDKQSEECLKLINHAYAVLRSALNKRV